MSKLLVVDDNPFYRKRLKELFDCEGHDVETADCAASALITGRRFRPDVLIVDRMLRDRLDGFEVAQSLLEASPDMKTIVITGYPSPSVDRKAAEARVFAFFEKPFDVPALCDTIRRVFDSISETPESQD